MKRMKIFVSMLMSVIMFGTIYTTALATSYSGNNLDSARTIYSSVEITDEQTLLERAINNMHDTEDASISTSININNFDEDMNALSTTQLLSKKKDIQGKTTSEYVTNYIYELEFKEGINGEVQLVAAATTKSDEAESAQGSDVRVYAKVYWTENQVDYSTTIRQLTKVEANYTLLDSSCTPSNLMVRGYYGGAKRSDGYFTSYLSYWTYGSKPVSLKISCPELAGFTTFRSDAKVTLTRGNQTWDVNASCEVSF